MKALTAAGGQALVTVTGNGMLGVPGIAARTFAALHGRQISVSLISQASSEHSICFSVPETRGRGARESCSRQFARRDRAAARSTASRSARAWRRSRSSGWGCTARPASRRACSRALAAAEINVVAIAQGIVRAEHLRGRVEADQAAEAQRRDPRRLPALANRRRRRGPARAHGRRAARLRPDRSRRWPRMVGAVAAARARRSGRRRHRPLAASCSTRGPGPAPPRRARAGEAQGRPLAPAPAATAATRRGGDRGTSPAHALIPTGAGGPHGRRDRARARAGAHARHGPRARQQAAARRAPRRERALCGRPRGRAAGACCTRPPSARGSRSSTPSTSSMESRRPRAIASRAALGHAGLPAQRGVGAARRSRDAVRAGDGAAATPSPIRATTSPAWTWRARR